MTGLPLFHFPNLVSIVELDRLHDQLKGLPFRRDSLKHIDNLERQHFGWDFSKSGTDSMIEHLDLSPLSWVCFCHYEFLRYTFVNAYFSQKSIIQAKQANKMYCDTLAHRFLAEYLAAYQEKTYHSSKPGNAFVKEGLEIRYHRRYLEKKLSKS